MILCDWRGGLLLLVTKVSYFTCTWLKKYFMYLMPPRYIEYLNMCAKNMKKQKQKKLVLKSSTSKNTWLRLFLQLISSPSTVFDANILSNITSQLYIPKDLLCIFNFPSPYSVFVHSPCGQIYVSTVYHKNNGYCLWLLLAWSWGNRLKSIGLVNKQMRSFKIYVLHFIQCSKNLAHIVQLIMNHYRSDLGNGLTACRQQTIIRIHNIQV